MSRVVEVCGGELQLRREESLSVSLSARMVFTSISPPFEAPPSFLLVASLTFCIPTLRPELERGVFFTAIVRRRSQDLSVDQVEVFARRFFLLCFVFWTETVFLIDLPRIADLGRITR